MTPPRHLPQRERLAFRGNVGRLLRRRHQRGWHGGDTRRHRRGGRQRRADRFAVASQRLGLLHQLLRRVHLQGLHRRADVAYVPNRPRDQVLADKIEPKGLIPRCPNVFLDHHRFVTILDQAELVNAVVCEGMIHRGRPDRMIFFIINDRPIRIGGDDQSAFDATRRAGQGQETDPEPTHAEPLRHGNHPIPKERREFLCLIPGCRDITREEKRVKGCCRRATGK